MAFSWIPSTYERILRPFLDGLEDELRKAVEQDLAKLLADPQNPGFLWMWWRGTPESPSLSKSRLGILAGRIALRYIVLADMPMIAVVNAVDLGDSVQVREEP